MLKPLSESVLISETGGVKGTLRVACAIPAGKPDGTWENYDYDWMFEPEADGGDAMARIREWADGIGPDVRMLLKHGKPMAIKALSNASMGITAVRRQKAVVKCLAQTLLLLARQLQQPALLARNPTLEKAQANATRSS